jgi:hypothetical protein
MSENENVEELSDVCKDCQDAIIERSHEHSHEIFHGVWETLNDHPGYDIEVIAYGLVRECAHFLALREWEYEDILENVTAGVNDAKEFLAEEKKNEEDE